MAKKIIDPNEMLGVMLAANKQPVPGKISWPKAGSLKLNGIRCLLFPTSAFGKPYCPPGKLLFEAAGSSLAMPISRSAKAHPNPNIRRKLAEAQAWCDKHDRILDGELYSPSTVEGDGGTLGALNGIIQSGKGNGTPKDVPDDLIYYVFDCMTVAQWQNKDGEIDPDLYMPLFEERYRGMQKYIANNIPRVEVIEQVNVESWEEVEDWSQRVFASGGEGLILRAWDTQYQHRRCGLAANDLMKLKDFDPMEGEIIDIIPMNKIADHAVREKDAFGRSKSVHKKGEKDTVEAAGSIKVRILDQKILDHFGVSELIISMGSGLCCKADNELNRHWIWENRSRLIGCVVEFKAMLVDAKDVPTLPVLRNFRWDKCDRPDDLTELPTASTAQDS